MFGSMGFHDDPMFRNMSNMMQNMNNMMNNMNSMMGPNFGGDDPFDMGMGGSMMGGSMMGNSLMLPHHSSNQMALMGRNSMSNPMMGNPMAMMNSMMSNMDNMRGESASQVFSSSTVMSMSTGPDGRPQVYQSSSSSRGMPGGIRETQQSVVDSRTGQRRMAIGRHIGDRSQVIERVRGRDGEEENTELVNLDEDELEEFEQQFRQATRGPRGAIRPREAVHQRVPQLAIEPSRGSGRTEPARGVGRTATEPPRGPVSRSSTYDRSDYRSRPARYSSDSGRAQNYNRTHRRPGPYQ